MTKLILSMPDLHCASCEKLVKTSIGSRQGIQSISVSLENKEVEVLYNPEDISSSMIINLLREGTGYSVEEKIPENEIINNEIPVQEEQPQKESVQESKDNNLKFPEVTNETISSMNIYQAIQYSTGSVVSKAIKTVGTTHVTLFSMDAGTEIEDHTSTRNGIVYVLEGDGTFVLEGKPLIMKTGEMIFMPKNAVHSLKAKENTSFLLTLTD